MAMTGAEMAAIEADSLMGLRVVGPLRRASASKVAAGSAAVAASTEVATRAVALVA
jgi:hypothetical protein